MSVVQGTPNRTEIGELGRRLQRAHGEHWLHRVKGDPYADVLRGHTDDPHPRYEEIRALGGLWRSSTGAWVTADHGVSEALLSGPWPHTAVTGDDAHVPVADAGLGGDAAHYERLRELAGATVTRSAVTRVCHRAVDGLPDRFDLVTDLAERVPVDLLGETFGLSGPLRRELADACAAAGVLQDGVLCPQRLEVTRRATTAVDRLRSLFARAAGGGDPAADSRALAILLATAGVRTAATLITNAVLAVVDHPGEWARVADEPAHAAHVVAEALRHDSPVQLHPVVARADSEFAGQLVSAGERVVVLVGAANRDPAVFAEPGRFVTGRAAPALLPALHHRVTLPFARRQAEAVVRALVAGSPGSRRAGPQVRSRRSPVTRNLLRCPLAVG
ncbi:cytochrome P450 family protein [Streptomyces sp. NPDC055078]